MCWLAAADATSATPLDAALTLRPELAALYRQFRVLPHERALVPAEPLALGRLRIAMLHGCPPADTDPALLAALAEWPAASRFGAADRAVLAIAEKLPWRQHEISDAEVAAAVTAFGEPGCVALLVALALADAECRLNLVFMSPG